MKYPTDGPVPDPPNSSYAGLNEQLLRQRPDLDLTEKAAIIINDHAPVQNNRYLPFVVCATPACNFRGEYMEHSRHVAGLVVKALGR
jgi:hypothetical protein